jgi:hypothetical protein
MTDFTKPDTVFVSELCKRHYADSVRRMNYGPNDKWQVALICLQILLWQRVMVSSAIQELPGEDIPSINAKLKEIGCFACVDDSTYQLACRLIRDKGLDHMVAVSQMKTIEPEWFAQ